MGKIISNGIEYTNPIGTTIVPNPEGTPTDELNSIQIGSDIYSISGGSGGESFKKETLYSGTTFPSSSIQLLKTINEYDFIGFDIGQNPEHSNWFFTPTQLKNSNHCIVFSSGGFCVVYSNANGDEISFGDTQSWTNRQLYEIYGIKFGGGSVSWKDITGTLTAGQTSIILSDSSITTNSTIEPFTDKFGVNPTSISVSTGSVTLTFESQSSNLGVKVRVS